MKNWFFSILFITSLSASECRYETLYNHFDLPTTVTETETGLFVQRLYNERGDLIEEIFPQGHSIKNVYDDEGHRIALILPDGTSIKYLYNENTLVAVQRLDAQENVLYQHIYRDVAHEEMIRGAGTIEWGFDEQGRRISILTPYGSERVESLDEQGRILEMRRFSGPVEYHYKDNTLIEQTSLPAQDLQIQMDDLGRVVFVEKPGITKQFYEYDGLHRCTKLLEYRFLEGAWQPFKELFFIYDDQHEIGALDREGRIVQLKVLGKSFFGDVGNAVAIELDGGVFVPLNDLSGNIAALISSIDHDVIEWYPYQAFGPCPVSCPISPWRYWSKRTDEITNLVNFGKRFYDPSLQKWIGTPGDDIFMNNNPLFHLDFYTQASSDPPLSVRIGKSIKHYCFHLIPFPGLRDLGLKVSDWLGAEGISDIENNPDSHLGWVGNPDSVSTTAIVWINGLNTDFAETVECASIFSDIFNHRVYYAYNKTHGFMADLWTHLGGQFYIYPPAVEIAIKSIRGAIQALGGPESGGQVIILAHSQGGAVLEVALSYLTEPELKMLHIHTFGTAALFDQGQIAEVHHNIARRDCFPFIADPYRYSKAIALGSPHVTILDNPNGGSPLVNHGILGPVYLPAIHHIAHEMTK